MPAIAHTAEALTRARAARDVIGRGVGGRDISIAITKMEEAGARLNQAFFGVDEFNPLAAHVIDEKNNPLHYQLEPEADETQKGKESDGGKVGTTK